MRESPEAAPYDHITGDALGPGLRTQVLGRNVLAFGSCDSTNEIARRLIEKAGRSHHPLPPNGTLIVADHQTAGRGRNGRAWVASAGSALLFSLILYPTPAEPGKPQLTTMAAALSVVRGLDQAGARGCAIKWPNDVLGPDGRKVCGILTERVAMPRRPVALVTGIGINVAQSDAEMPEDIRKQATSARQIAGKAIFRQELLRDILHALEKYLSTPEGDLSWAWRRHSATVGHNVRITLTDRRIMGQALGLEEDGSLIVRLPNGMLETVRSGDVEELRLDESD